MIAEPLGCWLHQQQISSEITTPGLATAERDGGVIALLAAGGIARPPPFQTRAHAAAPGFGKTPSAIGIPSVPAATPRQATRSAAACHAILVILGSLYSQ
jgi:hypothetical protein